MPQDQLGVLHEVQQGLPPQMDVLIMETAQLDLVEVQHDLPDPLDHHQRHVPHVRPHDREVHPTTGQAHQAQVQAQRGLAVALQDRQEVVVHLEEINLL